MTMSEILAQDRRAAILLTLNEATGYMLNEDSLKLVLGSLGHRITRDMLRADLAWLAAVSLVRIESRQVTSGELQIAHLQPNGQDVANGAPHPGIARLRPA